jgi:glycosyltransferase involved in cell wall biosynthesis
MVEEPGHEGSVTEIRDRAVEISIVLPVYRNRQTLEELHGRLSAALGAASLAYELLFVDDASPDGSGDAIGQLSARDPRVRAIHLPRNVGQHRAAWLGLSAARGAWAVVMDADLQDPPEAIPALLAAAPPGVDAVFAARRGRYEGPGRLLMSRLFKTVRQVLTGIPRDAGMFLALRRPLVEEILRHDVPRPFLTAMVGLSGRRFVTVPVERSPRPCGTSAYSSAGRLLMAGRELAFVFRHRKHLTGGESE